MAISVHLLIGTLNRNAALKLPPPATRSSHDFLRRYLAQLVIKLQTAKKLQTAMAIGV